MLFGNRFTEKAEKVLKLAKEIAIRLRSKYMGTEHVLLGLIEEGEGIAARVLIANDVTIKKIENKLNELFGNYSSTFGEEEEIEIELTPRTKRMIEMSSVEALALGHNYIGTEHLLIALLREGDSVATRILFEVGADIQKLYNEIIKALNEFPTEDTLNDYSLKSKIKKNPTPALNKYGQDLTKLAKENKFDPIVGRGDTIKRIIQILCRRTKNNPCLVGEPGTGKTAVVEGLAQHIANGNVPETLKEKKIIILDLSSMIAGTKYRGQFEERFKKAMEEIKKNPDIIIFIDEIHTIIGAGSGEGTMDAANILKPALSRGEIQIIGATTLKEYRKYIEKDSALERRFQPIYLEEPSEDESIKILKGIRDKYEAHHKVKISDEAIEAAVKLSTRYIHGRFLPDKAIDLIDEAASSIKIKALTVPPNLKNLEEEIEKIKQEKEEAIISQEFEKAAKLRDKETETRKNHEEKKNLWTNNSTNNNLCVNKENIGEIISLWTGIKVTSVNQDESKKLMELEKILHERIIGQDEAVSSIAKSIRRNRVGLRDPKRPIGSFIFLGPTGVGKTELSKTLAESIFGTEESLIRVDMSEYMEKHNSSRLIGSPPGYIGHEEGGQLTEKVRRNPYSVVLFDEIEKAHPDIFNMLLQILEDGILTDSQGIKIDFRNTIIIMTSNLGARLIIENKKLGFTTETGFENDYEKIKTEVMEEVKKAFRPEFVNRVDDMIVFHKLTEENIKKITKKMLNKLKERMKACEINIEFSEEVIEKIAKTSYDPVYGARPLRRVIQTQIEDKVSEIILEKKIENGENILVGLRENEIVIEILF
ncbi:MAG: ATP-dependent Clp protease ATP-binding subunit [Clostridiales bacterium]|jgi:ATP-dependent Clp protease ATP-binding subunit ClpC|nr:ATP-dependent Clp protease ATP-binding subunit [Clostridiales bacterium]